MTSDWLEDLEQNWGRGVLYLKDFAPSLVGDKRYEDWYAKLERLSVSPGAAVALARMMMQVDVRDILPSITVPTLVLHKRDDQCVPLEEGRYIAEHVPGARFLELPGADHWPWIGHDEAVEEIQEFLTGIRESAEPDRGLATVVFIDIVNSTNLAAELGDREWASRLEAFYLVVRHELDRYRGKEIDTAGDGFFVTFDGPAHAIRCADELIDVVGKVGLELRIGVHTGECERIGDKVGGLGVIIGSRVGDAATAGEILVSRTVVDLVVGSDLRFVPRGRHELKGVPGVWELYAVDHLPVVSAPGPLLQVVDKPTTLGETGEPGAQSGGGGGTEQRQHDAFGPQRWLVPDHIRSKERDRSPDQVAVGDGLGRPGRVGSPARAGL